MTSRRGAFYRAALRAWPRDVRAALGDEVLGTLADTDRRGCSCWREVAALIGAGLRLRLRHEAGDVALVFGGLLLLAAAVAPTSAWVGSVIIFADGTHGFGSHLQAWPIREALGFAAALAIGRLGTGTVVIATAVPAIAWIAGGALGDAGVGYPMYAAQVPGVMGAGMAAGVCAVLVVLAARRWGIAARRRIAAGATCAVAVAGLPGSLDRDVPGGGVVYAHSWFHDLGPAAALALVGTILLLSATVLPGAGARSSLFRARARHRLSG